MEFEWDEEKRKINLEKHKIDFAEAVKIYDGFVLTSESTGYDYGEERYITIGLLNGVEIAVIYTPRNGKKRIISVRRARIKERKSYYEEKQRNNEN